MAERSKIAYVYCEECDFERSYDLPMSMDELGQCLEDDCDSHAESDCKGKPILAGSPKDE